MLQFCYTISLNSESLSNARSIRVKSTSNWGKREAHPYLWLSVPKMLSIVVPQAPTLTFFQNELSERPTGMDQTSGSKAEFRKSCSVNVWHDQ